jgi:hypothetical protein
MKEPNKWLSLLQLKCPNCRKGKMFANNSIFPLKEFMQMPSHCPLCKLKFERELGFWYGTGYISYGLCVALIFIMAALFALLVGFSYRNNSVFIFLIFMVLTLIVLQPLIMRYARALWIRIFVRYKQFEDIGEDAQ